MFSYEFKPKLWPTLISLLIFVCLILLGNWQVERLDWKLSLIEKLEMRAKGAPVELPQTPINNDDNEYLRIAVKGSFNNDLEVTMYSVGPNGEPGYDLYTPLMTNGGRSVIVNRGWVPEQIKDQELRSQSLTSGEVEIKALLRKPTTKLWYGPENDPDHNMWFYRDIKAMSQFMKLDDAFPMFLYAEKINSDNRYPVAGRTEFNIVNNHLDYALTWFGLAIVLVGIYFIAHFKKK